MKISAASRFRLITIPGIKYDDNDKYEDKLTKNTNLQIKFEQTPFKITSSLDHPEKIQSVCLQN